MHIHRYIHYFDEVHEDDDAQAMGGVNQVLQLLGIHYRGVQWEGGAVDWGTMI